MENFTWFPTVDHKQDENTWHVDKHQRTNEQTRSSLRKLREIFDWDEIFRSFLQRKNRILTRNYGVLIKFLRVISIALIEF